MEQRKVIGDLILATKDTIFVLQQWRDLLVRWRTLRQIEPERLVEACRQLKEAGLWGWANEIGGHGVAALVGMDDPALMTIPLDGNGGRIRKPLAD